MLVLGAMLLLAVHSIAQTVTITGTVMDENSQPLIGASVLLQSKSIGTTTDIDGNFTIDGIPGDVLEISYVGYQTQQITITDQTSLSITLSQGELLDEVVVTALGVSKERKTLGYAVGELNTEQLENSGNSNLVSSLQGRVAGVQVQNTSGAPGGGVDILIRGISSLDPSRSNAPLFVIDGVEVSNSVDVLDLLPSAASYGLSTSSRTQSTTSNRMVDLDPSDIESISVLKGGAATGLYGVRASNGAVIITTKRAAAGKTRINAYLGYGFSDVLKTPKVQTQFIDGHRSTSKKRGFLWDSWGAKVTDQTTSNPHNTYEEFFNTGHSLNTGVSFSSGSDKLVYRLAGNYSDAKGIVPESSFERVNLNLNTEYKFTDNIRVGANFTFSNSDQWAPSEGRKSILNVLAYAANVTDTRHFDEPYTLGNNFAVGIIDHPLYLAENIRNNSITNRYIGSLKFDYEITTGLSLDYTIGMDNYATEGERIVDPETDEGQSAVPGAPFGFMTVNNLNARSYTSNLGLNYEKMLNDDISFQMRLGHYLYSRSRNLNSVIGSQFLIDNFFSLSNVNLVETRASEFTYRNIALYGDFTFGYSDVVYLSLTGRNDWTSTLPKENRSYFFPSVSLSFIPSEFIDADYLDYWKLRLSYAVSGKDADVYAIGQYYQLASGFPLGDIRGFTSSTRIGDEGLRPEFTRTFEVGTEFVFLQNRLAFNADYYRSTLNDMILNVPVSVASGVSSFITNAGSLENWGLEFMLRGDILRKNEGLNWSTSFNWSKNQGKVKSIETGSDDNEIILADVRSVINKLVEGGKVGDLYGYPFQRVNTTGDLILQSDGLPRMNWDTTLLMGNAMPDFILGWNNDVSYKGFGLSLLWEWKKGGDVIDVTRSYSMDNGLLEESLGRYQRVVFDGVKQEGTDANGDPIYVTNDIEAEITPAGFYRNSSIYRYNAEAYLQDASWFRIRSLALSYTLDSKRMNLGGMDRVRLSVIGNNFYLNTPFHGFDPETNFFGASSNIYGYTGFRTPATKSWTFKAEVNF